MSSYITSILNFFLLDGVMGPPMAPPPMQRSASQLECKKVRTPKMAPRQKSCDDMKRNTIKPTVREGRSRYGQRSAASQRKFFQ